MPIRQGSAGLQSLEQFYRSASLHGGTAAAPADAPAVDNPRIARDIPADGGGGLVPVRYVLSKGAVVVPPPLPADEARPAAETPSLVRDAADARRWRALPEAVRALAALAEREDDESAGERRQLIDRLLNPLLTLEDAARLLGVHPGTVRRWANKGLLAHQRTVGQQRRFHLADVLACLEDRAAVAEDAAAGPAAP